MHRATILFAYFIVMLLHRSGEANTVSESSDLVLQSSNSQALKKGKSTELQGLGIGSQQWVGSVIGKRDVILSWKDSSEY